MKYEIPIVAADIHARETLGFSSFNSKSIINCILVLVTMAISDLFQDLPESTARCLE
jgi:hypothetical protein